jgi:hypothetical protein
MEIVEDFLNHATPRAAEYASLYGQVDVVSAPRVTPLTLVKLCHGQIVGHTQRTVLHLRQ